MHFVPSECPASKSSRSGLCTGKRSQCVSLRNQIAAHGRSLAVSFNILTVPTKWYGKKKWAAWRAELESVGQHWLIERLESKLPGINRLEEAIAELEQLTLQIAYEKEFPAAQEPSPPDETSGDSPVETPQNAKQFADYMKSQIPKGLGVATSLNLNAEMCDWNRFNNRKQVGSYIGACPSEHSSGWVGRRKSVKSTVFRRATNRFSTNRL